MLATSAVAPRHIIVAFATVLAIRAACAVDWDCWRACPASRGSMSW